MDLDERGSGLRKLAFLASVSSRPGVRLDQVDFTGPGPGRVPFAGGRFTVAPGATSRPDTHDVTECWLIASGSGRINYDGIDYSVAAGDCLFFEPRKTHFVHNDGEIDLMIHTVWWLEHAR